MALPETEKKQEKKEKPLTKVIVRRLPPTMDQETFLSQVAPIPDYNYIYTVKGDSSLGEYAFSRVYLNFVNSEDIFNFKERFDNYVFLDNKGHEYTAVVEFASFQKIPKKRGKTRLDPKSGSIESDPVYLDFVESLSKPQEVEEKPEYTLQLTSENKNDVTTPLLEYIKNKRAQRMRIREVRREERKRREFDRKKDRYDDRKKPIDEKSPTKSAVATKSLSKSDGTKDEQVEGEIKIEEKPEKTDKPYEKSSSSYYKNKERKYEDKKFERKEIKLRYPKKEYPEHQTYKRPGSSKEDYKTKFDDYKKNVDPKPFVKKVKKYSERREERKIEAQKAEQRKIDQANETKPKDDASEAASSSKTSETTEFAAKSNKPEKVPRSKETELQSQRRIRNKDRPTIAIYRPGMLSKRKTENEGSDSKETKNEEKK